MAAAFTVNSTTSRGPWLVIDATSTDITTSAYLLAAVAGNDHIVKSISIDYDNPDKWIKIFDGTDLQIGPLELGVNEHWDKTFESGMTFEEGVYFQTESSGLFHVLLEYKIVPSGFRG